MLAFIQTNSFAIYIAELLGLIAIFLVWESRRPFVARLPADTGARHVSHCLLFAVNQPAAIATGWLLAWSFAGAVDGSSWTLFSALDTSGLTVLIGGFLLLDLTEYARHRLMHLGWFWQAHQVHHSDRDMDWSTEFRFHPVEIVVTTVLRFAVIALVGISKESVVLYALAALLIGMLQHANVQLSRGVERTLSKVLVTPALHRVHHAEEQECYDRNFAVIFVWWDMLFRTYRRPGNERVFGLPDHVDQSSDLKALLLSPFR